MCKEKLQTGLQLQSYLINKTMFGYLAKSSFLTPVILITNNF